MEQQGCTLPYIYVYMYVYVSPNTSCGGGIVTDAQCMNMIKIIRSTTCTQDMECMPIPTKKKNVYFSTSSAQVTNLLHLVNYG